MAEGFRNRVDTNVVPVAQRDPAAFRSGVAEGVEAIGGALNRAARQDAAVEAERQASELRIARVQQDRARSATVADRLGAWPDVQLAIQNKLDDLRNTVDASAPDYQERADAIVTEQMQSFRATLGDDPEVVERFAPIMATFSAGARQGERRYSLATRAKREGANVDKWADAEGVSLQDDPTPERLTALLGQTTDGLIGALDAPPDVKAKVIEQKKRGFVRNFLDGLDLKGNYQGLDAVLKSGQLNAYLDPETKARYAKRVEGAAHVAAQEAEAAANRVRGEARDAAAAIEAKVKAGIVPTPAEVRVVEERLASAKVDPAEMIDFGALSVKIAVNRRYAGVDPMTLRRDRDRLASKMIAGNANEAEQVTKKQLDDLVDDADEKQAAQLRDLVSKGVPGRVQALTMIQGSPEQRRDVAEKIETGLGAVANLGPKAQAAALDGREIRKARLNDFGRKADADIATQRLLGPALTGALTGQYDEVRNVAWDIMAHNLAVNGRSGFDADVFNTAVNTAMGATLRPGGVMQGGVGQVRGKPVWLPSWQTPGEFDRQLSRTDFGGAVYANGKPAHAGDVLAHYRPDYVGDDDSGRPMYRLVDAAGGALQAKAGGAFIVRPRRPR